MVAAVPAAALPTSHTRATIRSHLLAKNPTDHKTILRDYVENPGFPTQSNLFIKRLLRQRSTANPEVHHGVNEGQGAGEDEHDNGERSHLLVAHDECKEGTGGDEERTGKVHVAPGRRPGGWCKEVHSYTRDS